MAVESAVSMAVEKLSELAIQKVSFLLNVKEQATLLKEELNKMQCFLEDATEKQFKDKRMREWISSIRDVAYDTEDVIESFYLKVNSPARRRGLLRCFSFPKHVYHLNRLGQEIESIQKRLNDIDETRVRYGIETLDAAQLASSDVVVRRRRVSPWEPDKDVIGVEEHMNALLERAILLEKESLSITSIVGMGGAGKSTLAKKVYNHADVRERFDCLAWVTVSREFILKELLMKLLLQLEPGASVENLPEDSVEQRVHQHLKGKQYFIVLDDVWQQEALNHIAKVVPNETEKASRILITSRVHNISRSAQYVHEMKGLDSDQSWELFLKTAFIEDNGGKCPPELEDIGRKIVEKCNGLPLAICVMGGLLLEQGQVVSRWERVLKGIKAHLEVGEGCVSTILELSYQDLPPHLKSCFLYLSFFKEDEVIVEDRLITLWITEGIVIQGEGEETMEETAKGYLDELVNRNMVQATILSIDIGVRRCQVHDLLLDLSILKAKEEIKFHILNNDSNTSIEYLGKARHVAIWCDNESLISSFSPNPHLRSLLFSVSTGVIQPSVWKKLRRCRVLQLECKELRIVPETIGSLIGLKFFRLVTANTVKLPRSLGNLKNLQVLDLGDCGYVEMPNVIWKLDTLCHLYLTIFILCKERLRLDTLKNLQTLQYVSIDKIIVDNLAEMISLRNLLMKLTAGVDVNNLLNLLAKLQNLVSVDLYWDLSECYSLDGIDKLQQITLLCIGGPLEKLPHLETCFPKHLSHLELNNTCLREDPMLILGKLPNLLHLKLSNYFYIYAHIVVVHDGFPRLKVLIFFQLFGGMFLHIKNGGLPNLQTLETHSNLSILPEEEMRSFQTWEGNWISYYRP